MNGKSYNAAFTIWTVKACAAVIQWKSDRPYVDKKTERLVHGSALVKTLFPLYVWQLS